MKSLSFKQKFFIFLSILIFVFSTVLSGYYGLTNSKIEAVNSAFKLRPYTAIFFDENNLLKNKKIAEGEEYIYEGNQSIDLDKISLVSPYKTKFMMLSDVELKLDEYIGYFETNNEIKVLLSDFEIVISPEVKGIIDTNEKRIYFLDGLQDYNSQILEKNTVLNYFNGDITSFDREILNNNIYSKVVTAINLFKDNSEEQIDLEAPELISINLDQISRTNENVILVIGEAKDAAKIFINDLEVSDRAGEKFSQRQTLKTGDNFIDLRLEDLSGNIFEKRYVVTKVTDPEPVSFPN